jgi:hypothetical protein
MALDLSTLLRLRPDHILAPVAETARKVILEQLRTATSVVDAAKRLGISHRSLCRYRAEGLVPDYDIRVIDKPRKNQGVTKKHDSPVIAERSVKRGKRV